jgi:prolyl-tRNA synthetase
VGHIFQLGTKYSEAMKAVVLNDEGKSVPMAMGCYGIGVTRIVAAAIEQNHDDQGIIWPDAMAPFEVALVPLNMDKSEAVATATEALYEQLIAMGVEVFMDDRKERPGVKFAQMELIGIPVRVTLGDRSLAEGNIELQERTSDQKQLIPVSEASKAIVAMIRRA